jgi:ankyrin repeat protein
MLDQFKRYLQNYHIQELHVFIENSFDPKELEKEDIKTITQEIISSRIGSKEKAKILVRLISKGLGIAYPDLLTMFPENKSKEYYAKELFLSCAVENNDLDVVKKHLGKKWPAQFGSRFLTEISDDNRKTNKVAEEIYSFYLNRLESVGLPLSIERKEFEKAENYINYLDWLNVQDPDDGQTALMKAASLPDDKGLAALLLQKKANPFIRDKKGRTVLRHAIEKWHVGLIKNLISIGMVSENNEFLWLTDLEVAVDSGNIRIVKLVLSVTLENIQIHKSRALIKACEKGYTDIAKLLLDEGADINYSLGNSSKYTPLMHACVRGHTDTVKLLLDANPKPSLKASGILWPAIKLGKVELVNLLLDNGAELYKGKRNKKSALLFACAQEDISIEILDKLFAKGANIEDVDEDGNNALILAAHKPEVVSYLLGKGAKLDHQNKEGKTALMVACKNAKPDSVKALLESNADANIEDNDGNTALSIASKKGFPVIIENLLNCGAKPNHKNKKGETPLTLAALDWNHLPTEALLKGKADPNITDNEGKTPLMIAFKNNNNNTFKALLEGGANPNIRNKDGDTILKIACKKGCRNIIEELLKAGADPSIRGNEGLNVVTHWTANWSNSYNTGTTNRLERHNNFREQLRNEFTQRLNNELKGQEEKLPLSEETKKELNKYTGKLAKIEIGWGEWLLSFGGYETHKEKKMKDYASRIERKPEFEVMVTEKYTRKVKKMVGQGREV